MQNKGCRGRKRPARDGGATVCRTLKLTVAALAVLALSACRMSHNIIDLDPPAGLPHLEQLDRHMNYVDPDAGRTDYVRTSR